MPIDKTYNPAENEAKLYARWEESGAFACDVKSKAAPYTIMMPPPNVTGSLHMGHALTFTLQDILIRYQRMKGRDALWQPGTDHAGIATQMVVERELATQGTNMGRREMGREAFLKKVWEWKEQSGGAITKQLRRLGASCDWSRERFTMEPALSRAVTKAFVELYRAGLIFKDKRLVNWDPKMHTAVSDLEVEQREIKGSLWHFKYPIEGATDQFVIVATTRPETMLGDTAVAVHPKNERLKHLIGKTVVLPLVGRRIPIIADEYADPEKGTGAVKITPAHDFNDFQIGKRHKLPMINIFDQHARLNDEAPEKYRGLERFEARKRIVADMDALGLLDKVEPHTHVVPHGDRSNVPIEPWLSEQWYCDAKTLAQPAIKAVEDNRTKFVPEQWANTYYAWMRNIEPWCISRQLWWGHQIPAWYGPDGKFFVAEDEDGAKTEAQKHYGKPVELKRDEDVLDTWFSSALWSFSTLGWPDKTPELARYYPTDVLVTGFDIIFFWVARMMMMGLHFMKQVPFETVYIHALVRDEKGKKMSKTTGNVIDPLDLIDKYGCDAVRFTLAHMSTPGRDIKLASSRIEGNRNFATKLWNAARYCQMNECEWKEDFDPFQVKHVVNRWIVATTAIAVQKMTEALDEYRFDLASSSVYRLVWDNFCDWYLEFTKPILTGTNEELKIETRTTTAWVLEKILRMMHPFMPFITEELWKEIIRKGSLLISEKWPELSHNAISLFDKDIFEINWVIDRVSALRAMRAEMNVPAGAIIKWGIKNVSKEAQKLLWDNKNHLRVSRMARLEEEVYQDPADIRSGAVQVIFDDVTFVLYLANVIDFGQERARLGKESEKLAAEIRKIESKLSNRDFIDRAPPEIVDEQRERKAEAEALLARLQAAQKSLAG